MKINEKHIVIAIVAAVAVYLVLKKRKESQTASAADAGSGSGTSSVDVHSVESIIAASGMTSSDAAVVRKFNASVAASVLSQERIQEKARQRGYTYEQMIVLDGFWTKYCTMVDGKSVFKDEYANDTATKNYYWRVANTVKNL